MKGLFFIGLRTIMFSSLLVAINTYSQTTNWVAFNDHHKGGSTAQFANPYNPLGDEGGLSGPLTNTVSYSVLPAGARTPASISITVNGTIQSGDTMGGPNAGTPAGNWFRPYVDFGSGSRDAIQLAGTSSITYTFSGLDPAKKYIFKGTSARGGGYANRWTLATLTSVDTFTPAHTPTWSQGSAPNYGVLTAADGGTMATNEAAWNSGENSAAGAMIVFKDISPGSDGQFSIILQTYKGTVPGGASDGTYGYAFSAFSLEELIVTQTPVAITNQPKPQVATELEPATFSIGVSGNPYPVLQWFKNGQPLSGETNLTLYIPSVSLNDNGATFFVRATNTVSNVVYWVQSSNAVLTVIPDTNPPALLGAIGAYPDKVTVLFSEKVSPSTAINKSNYTIVGPGGNLSILSAALASDLTNVILTTAPLTLGAQYTVTVNNIKDTSVAGNTIAPNSQTIFIVSSFTGTNIGNPSIQGTIESTTNGYKISGAGSDIGGYSDQFNFGYQQRTGDFDVKVRVSSMSFSGVWAKAALMARDSLAPNSAFAAAVATPSVNGCYFLYRSSLGVNSSFTGSFPVNYPYTYLRLKRVGNTFTGYASLDGNTWALLGSISWAAPSTVYLGFAVTSYDPTKLVTALFADYGDVSGGIVATNIPFPIEPLGHSSRKTGLVISEIMYNPRQVKRISNGQTNNLNLEFIEIYNANPFFENIGGFRITGDIDFTFPTNTVIKGGEFIVLAKSKADVESYYAISGVYQYGRTNYITNYVDSDFTITAQLVNGLNKNGGTIQLRNRSNAVLLQVNFNNRPPWPIGADGCGHSLVLARPSYGEGDSKAWAQSDFVDGSPGRPDSYSPEPLRNIFINEFLALPNSNQQAFIELYNHSNIPVDVSGAKLTASRSALFDTNATNALIIPQGTVIPPRGFVTFYWSQLNFDLDPSGGRIYLINPSLTRIIDAIEYKGQMPGVSSGRSPDGFYEITLLANPTPGTNNTDIWRSPIVINEIMYKPISGKNDDEYIELYNRSANAVNISGWKFTDGITYTFPTNVVVQPGGYIVVGKSITNLFAKYTQLNSANTFGDYSGTLANKGEHIELSMPAVYSYNNISITNYVVVNEVSYKSGGRWGNWSDGGGSSLELKDPNSDNRFAANWADSEESYKSSNLWTTIQYTGPIGETLGSPVNDNVLICLLGLGECLVDDVEVISGGANLVVNPGFENGLVSWYPQGSHDMSTVDDVGYSGSRSLHIRAGSRGDNGANRVRSQTFSVNASSPVTIRAKARWLRGWPELLVRLHGGGAEAYGALKVPDNLGTPALPNSKLITNAGPAIFDVTHTPVLPAAAEAVVVTARVSDPDGIQRLQLIYRNDTTGSAATSVDMKDDGTGGDAVASDGIYSATIPGQALGTVIAFYLQATDKKGATNLFPQDVFPPPDVPRCFPNDAITRECVIRFGDTQMPGSFATYHVWLTSANRNRWANRDRLNNALMDATFVLNNYRVIYNFKPNYGGSPWHRGQMTTGPDGSQRVDFAVSFPEDDLLFGAGDFTWCNPGNPSGTTFSDLSMQSEQTSYEIFKGIGIHYNYRKYVHLFINGSQRSTSSNRGGNLLFEDGQQPNGDVVEEWFPDDPNGELYKIEDWFEFNDNGYDFSNNNDADLIRRTVILDGKPTLVIAPYRFMWRKRAITAGESANDYTNFFKIVDAVSPPSNPTVSSFSDIRDINAIINIEQWMRSFACQHTVGNWDSYGFNRGKNDYAYKPVNGRFELISWDIDFTMGVEGDSATTANLFNTTDPRVTAMWNTPEILRMYWRAYYDICMGPLQNLYLDPIIDAKAAAMAANNINYDPSTVSTIKSYISARRNYLLSQIPTAPFAISLTNFYTTNNNYLPLRGTAPVYVKSIKINGYEYPITWLNVTTWQATIVLNNAGTNAITVQGFDLNGNLLQNTTFTNFVIYTSTVSAPKGNIVFSEIMYNPTNTGASFVELCNNSTNFTFDLSGWRINGIGYTFPPGSFIPPRGFIVIAKNRSVFQSTYGISPFDEFPGALQNDGETLTLFKPLTDGNGNIIGEQIIDRVRYESELPWPQLANGQSASLQLIDSTNDTSRVCNWSDGMGWRYFYATATNTATFKRLYIFLDVAGDIYIDDIKLVAGTVPEVGDNLVRNGDFESPLLTTNQGGYWILIGAAATNSTIVSDKTHGGSGSLHLIQTTNGTPSQCIAQDTLLSSNGYYTISFWYLPTTNATKLTARMSSYLRPEVQVRPVLYTPGTNNSIAAPLPAIDPIWLNEVQAENLTGTVDNFGEHEPWVEIYNSGTNTIDLSDYYLTDSYSNLAKWKFPQGTMINPGEFKVVWLDDEENQTTLQYIHANFKLAPTNGSIAIVKLFNNSLSVIDYLNYKNLPADYSYGDSPDGQPFYRQKFYYPTAGATNNPASRPVRVYINEWMADNASTLVNPSTGGYDDWFELYNTETNEVDLSGYYLTDNPTNKTLYEIPNGCVIPPKGFLLVWADNKPTTTNLVAPAELHVNFALSRNGEAIGLYAPDGSVVDLVTFGPQTADVSEGRYPDGSSNIRQLQHPTPGTTNSTPVAGANLPPVIEPVSDKVTVVGQQLRFTVVASDPDQPLQQLRYE
ncbi:MAG: lamin tail domain-containing protein, partial [Verrucomicrobiia bacterium]